LGTTLHDEGEEAEAATSFQKALEIDPNHIAALYGFGEHLLKIHKPAQAAPYLQRCIDLQSDFKEAFVLLSAAIRETEGAEAAKAYCQKALKIDSTYAHAHRQLGTLHGDTGNFDAAAESFKHALKLKPDSAITFYELAVDFPDQCDEDMCSHMQQLFDHPKTSDVSRCHIGFGLYHTKKLEGQYDEAFTYLHKANGLRRKVESYDQTTAYDKFETSKRCMSRSRPELTLKDIEPGLTPIFIIGMPRSGTTLVE